MGDENSRPNFLIIHDIPTILGDAQREALRHQMNERHKRRVRERREQFRKEQLKYER